ncbi:MAG: hypothetical protein ACI923_002443, partial [Flavobacteriales bacterium]
EIHSIGSRLYHTLPLRAAFSTRISSNVKNGHKKRRGFASPF